jgi:hypothetical protein
MIIPIQILFSFFRLADCQSHRVARSSEKLLLNPEEFSSLANTSSNLTKNGQGVKSLQRERSLSNSLSTPRSSGSQKMCVQLQITISLLAVSICFILCTLPNCISTIMIQNYANDEHVRKIWQTLNYLSIVPLLITHSVNLFFYYLSSNMFRECFRECYLKNSRWVECLEDSRLCFCASRRVLCLLHSSVKYRSSLTICSPLLLVITKLSNDAKTNMQM